MSVKHNGRPKAEPDEQIALTLAQTIDLARSLLSRGEFPRADHVLSTVLAQLPDDPDALHLMGALRDLQGRSAEAIILLERAVLLKPNDDGLWNDTGNTYVRLFRPDDALAAYQRAVDLAGDTAQAATPLVNLARQQLKNDTPLAEKTFRRAIAIHDATGLAWYGLAEALIKQDHIVDGVAAWERGAALLPKSPTREHVARTLIHRDKMEAVIAHYQRWSAEDPDNPVIKHHLDALTKPDTAERASDAYVESVFDEFATTFDRKLALLDYHAPQLVADAVKLLYPDANGTLDIADAGCGTGLCGPLVKPWARRLSGFDLSGGMLSRAAERNVYNDLHKVELVSFLNAHPDEFDVLISADTLCYFGGLYEAMTAAHRAVRSGGHVLFTVEAEDDDNRPHRLLPSGRYAHSLAHLSSAATRAGLQVQTVQRVALRSEIGLPVIGWLVTLNRP